MDEDQNDVDSSLAEKMRRWLTETEEKRKQAEKQQKFKYQFTFEENQDPWSDLREMNYIYELQELKENQPDKSIHRLIELNYELYKKMNEESIKIKEEITEQKNKWRSMNEGTEKNIMVKIIKKMEQVDYDLVQTAIMFRGKARENAIENPYGLGPF